MVKLIVVRAQLVSHLLGLAEAQKHLYLLRKCVHTARRAMAIIERRGCPPQYFVTRPSYMTVADAAAFALIHMRRYKEAERLLQDALVISEREVQAFRRCLVGPLYLRLGMVYYDQGQYEESFSVFGCAQSALSSGHTDKLLGKWALELAMRGANVLEALGRVEEALEMDRVVVKRLGCNEKVPATSIRRLAMDMVAKAKCLLPAC